jgi:capsular exopolysaccharide synthesis family protein
MARLLRKADLEDSRVLLVTSPVSGEAKTTLATQLSMSLVRNGHRTVLVDFDMRRPSLNEVFGLEVEPGVSEVLRGDVPLDAAINTTSTDLLSLVPAGRWDRQAMAALARGAASGLIDRLREQFDFVIVDSSPVLPVADTRFVSQHVDIVLLSVLRDISRMPKIQAACEILAAFGVKNVETIVTGGSEQAYAKTLEYYSESGG